MQRSVPKVTIPTLRSMHQNGTPITVLTCSDYPTALLFSPHVDMLLVGDSLGMVTLGLPSTKHLTLEQMTHHCAAVSRGAPRPFLLGDIPFGLESAITLVKDGGVDGVKVEGGEEVVPLVKRLTSFGIPVMGHVGLRPQREASVGGFKVQGRTADGAKQVWEDAVRIRDAGAFGLVLEAVPADLGKWITQRLGILTIGIGAGNGTSGQVLVYADALGFFGEDAHRPRFVKKYADVKNVMEKGVKDYVDDVKTRAFPEDGTHTYRFSKGEWDKFQEDMKDVK
ncbi:ketopantoate hydroxymethyltransferase [Atractiella rhizophila]|nr:ketopantoate hydroxymethyltransferase [Atractiella rhizophila]